jgi:putative membrane protein
MTQQKDTGRETSGDRLVYFAAERTLLAWIRVGLGLMALGFVVDRFGLFLEHLNPNLPGNWHENAFSSWIGIVLVLLGMVGNMAAAVRYWRFAVRYRQRTDTRPGPGISLGFSLTLMTSVMAAFIVLFLIRTMQ